MTSARSGTVPLYANGVDHYRSPARRDPVKRVIEEPISHRVYDYAVRSLGKAPRDPLRVVDLGRGTGDGLSLITQTHLTAPPAVNECELNYLGVDLDPDMVTAARDIHREDHRAQFEVGDMRSCLPDEPVDLIMSCGVPYSHLTPNEIADVVTNTFTHVRDHHTRTVVVLDVLGRYSIEWPTWWSEERWPYAMTFFENDAPPIRDDMTHYATAELKALIAAAANAAGVQVSDATFTD